MKRMAVLFALAAALVALVAAGCGGGGSTDEVQAAAADTGAVPFDQAFIDSMVPHHEQAIQMATEAKEAGLSEPELVTIADDIIANQQGEIDQMLEWRKAWYGSDQVDPNGAEALGMSMEEMGMQFTSGGFDNVDDVNVAFATMMVAHHNGAIAMGRMALDEAEHPELEDLAQRIVDAQKREVKVMAQFAGEMDSMEGMDHS